MNSQKLCIFFAALIASTYLIEAGTVYNDLENASETYYTEPFSSALPFKNTIESQWQGIEPPGLAIYGWNTTAFGATQITVSQADIVTSRNVHYNRTHNFVYRPNILQPQTVNGFWLEVADPCILTLAKDETFRVHYHAETNGNDGRWGQYLRVETVPNMIMPPFGIESISIPVCRKVYTPDLVCEMISARFIKLMVLDFNPGQTEDFDIIIEAPLTNINETLSSITVTSGRDCPTFASAPTRQIYNLSTIASTYYEAFVQAHDAVVWLMLTPTNKLHDNRANSDIYSITVRSRRVTPSGDPLIPASDTLSGGAIFGIIVAILAGVGIVGFALYYFRGKWMPGQNNYSNLN